MKIEDKDIDKLLEDFQGADIKVPDNLDEKLNEKLNSIKPNKKYKSVSKYLVSSVLICILLYGFIPSFRIFANNVFEYIFGDLGIENAVQNGYKGIENQTINISGYDIEISNIYIDSLRLSFDTTIKNAEVEKDKQGNYMNTYFINVVDGYELGSITVDHGLNDNRFNTNIQIIGDGITKLYNEKKDKIEIKLRLTEGQYGEIYKEEIIGEKKVLFNIPKEIYDSKTINLNKTVTDGKLKVDIKDLKISPTMMYLRSGGGIDGIGDSFGLYNFKIVSEKGQIYKDNMILSATGDKDNLRQTIVPSIYYDDSKKFSLKADGFLIGHKAEVNIRLDDTYPKKINCLGTDITINKFERNDKGLNIEIEVNDSSFSYFGDVNLDGSYCAEEGYSENNTHEFVFNIKEKDNYKLIVEPIIKYKIPIDIDFTKE